MKKGIFACLVLLLTAALFAAFGGCASKSSVSSDSDTDTDTDADGDGDTDSNGDGDGDSDSDDDDDSDGDNDGDSDGDGDMDRDSDGDTDTGGSPDTDDAQNDTDSLTSADGDSDAGTDRDTDTDGYSASDTETSRQGTDDSDADSELVWIINDGPVTCDGCAMLSVPFEESNTAQEFEIDLCQPYDLTGSVVTFDVKTRNAAEGDVRIWIQNGKDDNWARLNADRSVKLNALREYTDLTLDVDALAASNPDFDPRSVQYLGLDMVAGDSGPWAAPTQMYVWQVTVQKKDTEENVVPRIDFTFTARDIALGVNQRIDGSAVAHSYTKKKVEITETCTGCARLEVPVIAPGTSQQYGFVIDEATDLSGALVTFMVKRAYSCEGYISFFMYNGEEQEFAAVETAPQYAITCLRDWTEITLDVDDLAEQNADFDSTQIWALGIRVSADNTTPHPNEWAVVYVDSVSVTKEGANVLGPWTFDTDVSDLFLSAEEPIAGSQLAHLSEDGTLQ